MVQDILKRIGILLLFVVLQALVFGRIHLFDCATPLLYVYFILLYPYNQPRWLGLVLAFFLGVFVDMFENTPGLASFSLTLTAFVQPYILSVFVERETTEDFVPSIRNMGWMKYGTYSFFLIFLFCAVFFSVDAFSFDEFLEWLLCVSTSFALTYVLILVIDSVRR